MHIQKVAFIELSLLRCFFCTYGHVDDTIDEWLSVRIIVGTIISHIVSCSRARTQKSG